MIKLNKLTIISLFACMAIIKTSHAELNASNYQTYEPDFVFDTYDALSEIAREHEKLGQNRKIEQKYLGKIIRTPLMPVAYQNAPDFLILSDADDRLMKMGVRTNLCIIHDEDNIERFAKEVEKPGPIEVIGKIKAINGISSTHIVLSPCIFIRRIK